MKSNQIDGSEGRDSWQMLQRNGHLHHENNTCEGNTQPKLTNETNGQPRDPFLRDVKRLTTFLAGLLHFFSLGSPIFGSLTEVQFSSGSLTWRKIKRWNRTNRIRCCCWHEFTNFQFTFVQTDFISKGRRPWEVNIFRYTQVLFNGCFR